MGTDKQAKLWNINTVSRVVVMPNGLQRIICLPQWVWHELDKRKKKAFDAAIALCWMRAEEYECLEAFDYLMAATAHSDHRRFYKFEYYIQISEMSMISEPSIPANDHYDPKYLPDFPDPWWLEAPCMKAYARRIRSLFDK